MRRCYVSNWPFSAMLLWLMFGLSVAHAGEDAAQAIARLEHSTQTAKLEGDALQSQAAAVFQAAAELSQLHACAEEAGRRVLEGLPNCAAGHPGADGTFSDASVQNLHACHTRRYAALRQHMSAVTRCLAGHTQSREKLTAALPQGPQSFLQARWGQVHKGYAALASGLSGLQTELENTRKALLQEAVAFYSAPGRLTALYGGQGRWAYVGNQLHAIDALHARASQLLDRWHAPLLARRAVFSAQAAASRLAYPEPTDVAQDDNVVTLALVSWAVQTRGAVDALRERVDAACAEDLEAEVAHRAHVACAYLQEPRISPVCREEADAVCDGEMSASDEETAIAFFRTCLGGAP